VKIRAQLALWYAGVMFASLLLVGVLSYHRFDDASEMPQPGRGPVAPGRDDHDHEPLTTFLFIAARAGVPALLVAVAGGWWLTKRSLAPVEALTLAIERTHERNLHEQLPRSGNGDELDRLTQVFNEMTTRLDQSFQRIRDFTLHASHELKTPLTVMQGELETACGDERLPDAQRDQMASLLDEVQRLATIVDGLSLLTKADAGQVALAMAPVQLDELVRETVEDARYLGESNRIEVRLVDCEPVEVNGDRHRLRQVLLNLADNAVKYNEPGGSVVVTLRRADGRAELTMANTGPGLDTEDLAKVFNRFFRGDRSHSSTVEGSGLGLSIAQWIVDAHGGRLDFESKPGGPTTVSMQMPAVSLELSQTASSWN
jgi:signal transduction histidine kinase